MVSPTLSLSLSTRDGMILANGDPFIIKGATWWGAESSAALPGGLRERSLDDIVTFVTAHGFNAIKLPVLHQHALFNRPIPATSFDPRLNPFLLNGAGGASAPPISYLEMLLVVARRAAARGVVVWLTADSAGRLWYSRSIDEDTVRDSWSALSRQLCLQWNLGADVKAYTVCQLV